MPEHKKRKKKSSSARGTQEEGAKPNRVHVRKRDIEFANMAFPSVGAIIGLWTCVLLYVGDFVAALLAMLAAMSLFAVPVFMHGQFLKGSRKPSNLAASLMIIAIIALGASVIATPPISFKGK